MSTGISISSINQIKELAEQKKYAEALEILDTQDLDKSINPQFLRISGEIFRENKRYFDSWRTLLRSHEMAPQGTRIIADIIMLHLELGYFSRAKKYYEQFLFYSTDDDLTKDYVEYIFKKATGTDVKELASILIPILENMPEDKWNFEAVLLYDKLDRKDKALEESQYILENFKESNYIKPVIEYIDDKLDVDEYFYVYPKEEVPENKELYAELIEKEDKLLEADHLRMYPPEAKIMVEADDADAMDVKPVKEKKQKNKKSSKKKNKKNVEDTHELLPEKTDEEALIENEKPEVDEEAVKKEREAALDKLLSRKVDKESIRESAKQVAKNVSLDAEKAKKQVKTVTDSVIDNVKKATDSIGDAVGTSKVTEKASELNEEFVDGIIESVLEPPKRAVGEVVTNEELDALIPDSLEAMSAEEVKEIEAKKEEQERLELEALEASLKLQEKQEEPVKDEPEEEIVDNQTEKETIARISFNELKAKYLAYISEDEEDDEKPLESLGFISVVQSDVDNMIEHETPEAAEILHRMIDNKEFYTGENSRGFESVASYGNHGFEVDDYTFNEYIESLNNEDAFIEDIQDTEYSVKDIFAKESVLDFDDITPEVDTVTPSGEMIEDTILHKYDNVEETAEVEKTEVVEEVTEVEKTEVVEKVTEVEKTEVVEEVTEVEKTEVVEKVTEVEEPVAVEETSEAETTEIDAKSMEVDEFEHAEDIQEDNHYQDVIWESETASYENDAVEDYGYSSDFTDELPEEESAIDILSNRDMLRVRIILTDYMVKGLLDLKESR
ncbi:MAG: hypothetical protein E7271_12300 [Lachnospiraceae bacterium]|nr:hypothetical protein [Lachnospiraceae bacterium]